MRPKAQTQRLTAGGAGVGDATSYWNTSLATERCEMVVATERREGKHHHTIYAMGHICIKDRLTQIAKPLKPGRLASFPGHCVLYAG